MSKQIELSITIKDKLVESKKRIDDAKKAIAGLQTELKKLEKQQDDLGAQEKNGLITAAQRIESGKEIDKQIKTLNSQLDKQIVEQAKANAEYESTYEVLKKLTAQQQALDNVTSGVSMSLDEMKEHLTAIKGIKGQPTEISAEITTAAKELESKIKGYEKLEKSADAQLKELYSFVGKLAEEEKEKLLKELNAEFEKHKATLTAGGSEGDNKITELMLEQEYQARKAKVEKEFSKKITEEKLKEKEKEYYEDFEKFKNNEVQKYDMQKAWYQDIQKELRDKGVDTTDIDLKLIELEESHKKTIAITENKALNITKIERDAAGEKLKLYDKDTKEYSTALAKKLELDTKYHNEQVAKIKEYAASAKSILSEFFNWQKIENDNEFKEEEKRINDKLKALAEEYKGREEELDYKTKKENLEKELDDKKQERAKKQAIREKAMKAFDITLNTSAAIMKIWAEVPKFDFGVSTTALTAIAAGIGAAQLAAVLAAPIPKAATGGLIKGPAHAQGGVLIEAEGGEYIINKKSSALFGGLLAALNNNNIGRYNTPFGDGGFAYRTLSQQNSNNINAEAISAAVTAGMQNASVCVAIEDIDKMQRKIDISNNEL